MLITMRFYRPAVTFLDRQCHPSVWMRRTSTESAFTNSSIRKRLRSFPKRFVGKPSRRSHCAHFARQRQNVFFHQERSATRAHLLSAWKQVRSAERVQVTPNSRIAGSGTQLKKCVFGNIYGVTFGVR